MKIFGLLNLILLVLVLSQIWQSHTQSQSSKILWTLGVVFFPFLGSLLWLFIGRNSAPSE